MIKRNIYVEMVVVFILLLIAAFFIRRANDDDLFASHVQNIVVSVATFIFGITIAFSISNRKSRFDIIREKLRKQDAILLHIYYLSKLFDKKISDSVRGKIDSFLITQIDFELKDFHRENPENLRSLFLFFTGLKAKNDDQKEAKSKILEIVAELIETHKIIIYQISNRMDHFEWISALILAVVVMYCLFYGNNGSVVSMALIAGLGVSIYLPLRLLGELDSLSWQEQGWIWTPLSALFIELDLLPYVPDFLIKKGRVKLKHFHCEKIRLVSYPHAYPNFDDKKIKVTKLS